MSKERITLAELAEQMREVREGLFALRADLREAINAAEKLTKRRDQKAARQARWKAKKSQTGASIETQSTSLERKEGERENAPHTPYREREGERKVDTSSSPRARARKRESPVNTDPTSAEPHYPDPKLPKGEHEPPPPPPTLDEVLDHARSVANISEATAREFYANMATWGWRDKFNNPILNWRFWLSNWSKNERWWAKQRDPDRIPDARKGGNQPFVGRRPDNWLNRTLPEEDRVF